MQLKIENHLVYQNFAFYLLTYCYVYVIVKENQIDKYKKEVKRDGEEY